MKGEHVSSSISPLALHTHTYTQTRSIQYFKTTVKPLSKLQIRDKITYVTKGHKCQLKAK